VGRARIAKPKSNPQAKVSVMNIKGAIAAVSGGASGLGAATVRALSAEGAKVAVLDLNLPAAQQLARECGGLAFPCDVADAGSAESAIVEINQALGAPRILVNCAGVAPAQRIVGRSGPMSLSDFERVVRINLIGTFNLMRLVAAGVAALEPNSDGERGVIISTASIAAFEGQVGQAAYAASKAGVVGLTLPAAREFASFGLRVCAIAPGLFETPMLHGLPQEVQKSLGTAIPFPSRLGKPEEFAMLVVSIIQNPMLNGETIRLDGAIRMPPR
jgi:NAD(P)-dependent dehydrogenase (short-subunit alcohol dehydrogenase family)